MSSATEFARRLLGFFTHRPASPAADANPVGSRRTSTPIVGRRTIIMAAGAATIGTIAATTTHDKPDPRDRIVTPPRTKLLQRFIDQQAADQRQGAKNGQHGHCIRKVCGVRSIYSRSGSDSDLASYVQKKLTRWFNSTETNRKPGMAPLTRSTQQLPVLSK